MAQRVGGASARKLEEARSKIVVSRDETQKTVERLKENLAERQAEVEIQTLEIEEYDRALGLLKDGGIEPRAR